MRKLIAGLVVVALVSSCAQEAPPARPQQSDEYGCIPPEPGTFTKLGIDASLAKLQYRQLAVGALNVKTDPQVVDLLTKAARDASVRSYLRCTAIKQQGYNQEQAPYLDRMNAFMATSPSADEFIHWQQSNPFPRTIKISRREVTACDHLSVTAEWQDFRAPEQSRTCTFPAPDGCRIVSYRVTTNSDNNGSQSTSIGADGKSLSSTVIARPHGTALDRKRGWIDISVAAALECED